MQGMEQKKQLLIKVLTKLKSYRDLAEGILALINKWFYSEEMINKILLIINDTIKETKSEKHKNAFQKAAEIIKKIKEKEQLENNEEDIESLLSNI